MKRLRPRTHTVHALLERRLRDDAAAVPPLPANVVASLTAWWQLTGVPLPAIVADPNLLPPESLRLFVVDQRWQRSLLAGAFSVGRSASDQLAVDAQALTAALPAIANADETGLPVMSGILLRSGVVKGWPTMRVVGSAQGTVVPVVRRENLLPTVLLVLFAGPAPVDQVVFSEPAEAVHFGVDTDEDSGKATGQKTLRAITGTDAGNPLMTNGAGVTVTVPYRSAAVLDVAALAGAMVGPLNGAHGNDDGQGQPRAFTAREFAVEMIKGVQSVTVALAAAPAIGGR
jgi:hypothetical protein